MDENAASGAAGLTSRQQERLLRVAEAERVGIQQLPTDDPLDDKRRRRVEATWPELVQQPQALVATLAENAVALTETAARIVAFQPSRVVLVGAGDSLAVASAARYALEAMVGVPCEAVQCFEFARYTEPPPRALVVALSSSGETTRTVEAMLRAQGAGALTVAVTNTPSSTLAELSAHSLIVLASRVGWPTQSSTAALGLLLRLAVAVGALRGLDSSGGWTAALDTVPTLMAQTISAMDTPVAEIAAAEQAATMYLFCAGGPNWASAVVGAAKVKECSPDHALAIQVEEYHHYNSQKAGEPLWLLAPTGPSVDRAVDTAREARRFGGTVYVATTEGERAFDGLADALVTLPVTPELISPLLYFLPAQLMGYHVAMVKFTAAQAAAPPTGHRVGVAP